jgi:uncharacterized protein
MRVVLDANVLISALISGQGSPARIISLWKQEKFELVISPAVLEEIHRVLHYPRIQQKYHISEEMIEKFLDLLSKTSLIVDPEEQIMVVEKDPSDNRYLECATAAGADFLVTGDDHLLDLKIYQDTVILNAASFIAFIWLND